MILNVLTKDIEIFVNGSWQYPYLVTVPLNTCISAIFLFSVYGPVVIVCYISMAALLVMQYFTNNKLADLMGTSLLASDRRV